MIERASIRSPDFATFWFLAGESLQSSSMAPLGPTRAVPTNKRAILLAIFIAFGTSARAYAIISTQYCFQEVRDPMLARETWTEHVPL